MLVISHEQRGLGDVVEHFAGLCDTGPIGLGVSADSSKENSEVFIGG
jgi:hypothetical protein